MANKGKSIEEILNDVKTMAQRAKDADKEVEELFSDRTFDPSKRKAPVFVEEEDVDEFNATDTIFDKIIEDDEIIIDEEKGITVEEETIVDENQKKKNTTIKTIKPNKDAVIDTVPEQSFFSEIFSKKDKTKKTEAQEVLTEDVEIEASKEIMPAEPEAEVKEEKTEQQEIKSESKNKKKSKSQSQGRQEKSVPPVEDTPKEEKAEGQFDIFDEIEKSQPKENTPSSGENEIAEESVKTPENEPLQEQKYFGSDKTRVYSRVANELTPEEQPVGEPSIEEQQMEAEVRKNRQQKIDQFRVFAEKISGTDIPFEEEDNYVPLIDSVKPKKGEDIFTAVEKIRKPKKENLKKNEIRKKRESKVYDKIDVGRVKLKLQNDERVYGIRTKISLVFLVLSVVLEIIRGLYTSGKITSLSLLFDSKPVILPLLAFIIGIPSLIIGIKCCLSKRKQSEKPAINSDCSVLVLSVLNTIHNIILMVSGATLSKSVLFFNLAVYFTLLLYTASDKRENRMILKNLETLIKNESFLGVYSLGSDCEKVASGISSSAKPTVLCAGEVEIPNSFLDSSLIKDKQNSFFKFAVPAFLSGGIICAVIALLTYKNTAIASTAMMSAVSIMCPAFLTSVLTGLLADTNESLNRVGCEILGFEAIEYMDDTDAVVLDTAELFSGEISHFHTISPTSEIDTLNAFEIACSALYASGGVLKADVENLLKEQHLHIPEAEDVTYEERLGISCWIDDKCVLLGNLQMMKEHNIIVPPEYISQSYEAQGASTFFLAVDSVPTAMFAAEYFISKQAKRQLKKLYTTGIILMLLTSDPNIDEEFVAATLEADAASIKTVSPASAQQIKRNINETAKQKRTGLIFKRSVAGLVKVINCALRLYDIQTLTFLVQAISMVFGFGISFLLSLASTGYVLSPVIIVFYHILWSVLSRITAKKSK